MSLRWVSCITSHQMMLYIRARGADFQVGVELMRTRQREPTRGVRGILPRENLKLKSSEMARNGSSKTAKDEVNL